MFTPPVKDLDNPTAAASRSELTTFVRDVSCNQAYFAWRKVKSDKYLSPRVLRHFVRFRTIFRAPGGALYRLTPRGSGSTACS